MRFTALTIATTLLFSTATFAQEAKKPAAPVQEGTATAKKAFKEPNLRLPEDSGGIITDPIIVGAPIDTDFVMGKANAPITIVEYASMTCPHCAHFHATVLPPVKKNYIDTGKVKYILRQFPLNEPALKAAMLLQCVGEQSPEKYYVFTKVLFDAQNKWAFDSNYMAGLQTIANVGGVSTPQFTACTSSTEREMATLKRKKTSADKLKIPHTPYVIIGNEVYKGERTPELITQFIDKKLAERAVVNKVKEEAAKKAE